MAAFGAEGSIRPAAARSWRLTPSPLDDDIGARVTALSEVWTRLTLRHGVRS
jgi:hypothetical protein